MKCPFCHQEIAINKQFCPHCGQKVDVTFDQIAGSVRDDAALRRGRSVEDALRYLIVAAGIVGSVIWGLNDLWDRRLAYGGADTPSLESPPPELGAIETINQPYRDLFPADEMPESRPRVFGYRTRYKKILRERNRSSPEFAKCIDLGLSYLRKRQEKDGSWSVNTGDLHIAKNRDESTHFAGFRIGLTSLCLLPFLGEGIPWWDESGGADPNKGAMVRALACIVKSQDKNGRFGNVDESKFREYMYQHALATQALSEAAGLSGDVYLADAAQKAVDLIESVQGENGGWSYRSKAGDREDTSVTAWQVQALLAAREAGLKVNEEVLKKALGFFRMATEEKTGRVEYWLSHREPNPRQSLYGVGLLMRQWLGEDNGTSVHALMAKAIAEKPPVFVKGWGTGWTEGRREDDIQRRESFNPYTWYFATYALFNRQDENWEAWNSAMAEALPNLQDGDGAWHASDVYSAKAGAPYATALCLLCLQVYYRVQ